MFSEGKEVSFWFELLGGLKQMGKGGYNCSVWRRKGSQFCFEILGSSKNRGKNYRDWWEKGIQFCFELLGGSNHRG